MNAQPQDMERFLEHAERGVLRVLAGPQSGAEIALLDGVYLVGSDDSCDVVLFDDSVAPVHLAITVSEERFEVEAREAAVALVAETLRPGESTSVNGAQAITLGATRLGIGARDTDWSALAVPELPELDDAPPDDAPPDDAPPDEAPDGDATASPANDTEKPAEPGAADGEPKGGEEPAASEPSRPRGRRWPWLAVPAALIAALVAWVYVQTSGKPTETAAATAPDPAEAVERAEAVVAKLNLAEVSVEADSGVRVALNGYLADAAQHQKLRTALDSEGIEYVDRLRTADDLIKGVRLTLAAYSWATDNFDDHLIVGYAGNGAVFVDGFLGPEVDRTALRRHIMGDVPGIATLDFRRAGAADWKSLLDKRLTDAGLHRWLTTQVSHGDIQVSGDLTELEASAWRRVGEAFVAESRGWPKLDIAVRLAGPPPAPVVPAAPKSIAPPVAVGEPGAPDIAVVGIITSDSGFERVLLSDGETLAEGDTVEGKFVVAEIHADRVVLRVGDRNFTYHVKETE